MDVVVLTLWGLALLPALLMSVAVLLALVPAASTAAMGRLLVGLAATATIGPLGATILLWPELSGLSELGSAGLRITSVGAWVALLVQLLATVIVSFTLRYLSGEPMGRRHLAALAAVIAAVQWLLLADHWLVLIPAWSLVGFALEPLLCFYPDRPFALLAAHKKRIADRIADGLLILAAAAAWKEVGSGSLSDLRDLLADGANSVWLQSSAVLLALAVLLRTALFPVHGWLIQVMEAPTPVSALLHAGVVNLGGFLLIRFAPLIEHAPLARWLLVLFGLMTALLAGLVMLTRISIKVRLAWSTVAQMGFMVLECGLGLYTFAALHLLGHSLYKAHAFLASGDVVRQTRLGLMAGAFTPTLRSLLAAPALAFGVLLAVQPLVGSTAWPIWWVLLLAIAWAPLLWWPVGADWRGPLTAGLTMLMLLSVATHVLHALPLGLADAPHAWAGWMALLGLSLMYLCLVVMQVLPSRLAIAWRWSYAGFYVDERFTRFALRVWPVRWAAPVSPRAVERARPAALSQPAPRLD